MAKIDNNSISFPLALMRQRGKKNSGFVYIFSIGADLYKVGKARNWKVRLFTFQAANPEIKMVHVVAVRDRHKAELAAHESIENKRVKREIFKLKESDIEKLLNLLSKFVEV